MKNKNTTSALIKALNLLTDSKESPPKGWMTAMEFADSIGRSLSHTSKQLRKGLLAGVVQTKIYRVKRNGAPRCIPYYNVNEKRPVRPVRSKRKN